MNSPPTGVEGSSAALRIEMPRTPVHHNHQHRESANADMREAEAENQTSTGIENPIGTGSRTAGDGDGDQAAEESAGRARARSRARSSNAFQQEALEWLHFYRALFAEDTPQWCGGIDFPHPEGTTIVKKRMVQAYYYLTRVAMLFLLFNYGHNFSQITGASATIIRYTALLPAILATLACLASTFVLPSKFKDAVDDVIGRRSAVQWRLLEVEDIHWAGRRAFIYSAVWLVFGIIIFILSVTNESYRTHPAVGNRALLATAATIPTLGAIFFIFALDVVRIKKEIAGLEDGAQDMSLTLEAYQRSQEYIEGISSGTKRAAAGVAVIALFNVVGLLMYIYYDSKEKIQISTLRNGTQSANMLFYDLGNFAIMGKEAFLFFAFVSLAVVVNDAADDVSTEVYLWPTAMSSDDDATRRQRRLELIAQATTFVGPKQRKRRGNSWRRLAASHAGGISLKVLGVRWTSTYFAALLLSAGVSLLNGLMVRYSHGYDGYE